MKRTRLFFGFVADVITPVSKRKDVAAQLVSAASVPQAEEFARRILEDRYGLEVTGLELVRQGEDGEAILQESTEAMWVRRKEVAA